MEEKEEKEKIIQDPLIREKQEVSITTRQLSSLEDAAKKRAASYKRGMQLFFNLLKEDPNLVKLTPDEEGKLQELSRNNRDLIETYPAYEQKILLRGNVLVLENSLVMAAHSEDTKKNIIEGILEKGRKELDKQHKESLKSPFKEPPLTIPRGILDKVLIALNLQYEEPPSNEKLAHYVNNLEEQISHYLQVPKKEAKEILRQLESLGNMQDRAKNRQNKVYKIATTSFKESPTEQFTELTETSVNKITANQFKEYKKIYDPNPNKHPTWFSNLPEVSQAALKKCIETAYRENHKKGDNVELSESAILADLKEEDISRALSIIPSNFRYIPGLANHSKIVYQRWKREVTDKQREDYIAITTDRGLNFFMLGENSILYEAFRPRTSALAPVDIADKKERVKLTVLNIEQLIENHAEEAADRLVQKLNKKGSLKDGDALEIPLSIGTLVSPKLLDIKGKSDEETQIILTLRQAIEKYIKDPKSKLETVRPIKDGKKITVNFKFILTNHPVNAIRNDQPTIKGFPSIFPNRDALLNKDILTEAEEVEIVRSGLTALSQNLSHLHGLRRNSTNCKYLLQQIEKKQIKKVEDLPNYFDEVLQEIESNFLAHEEKPDKVSTLLLAQSLRNYIQFKKQGPRLKDGDDYNYELHLAALEQNIVEASNGLSVTPCKSGKDRRALQLLWADALKEFFFDNGYMPDFKNERDRKAFNQNFIRLFITRHHQSISGQNAPGVNAMQHVANNLPAKLVEDLKKELIDIADEEGLLFEEVDKNALKLEEIIAHLNKAKYENKKLKKAKRITVVVVAVLLVVGGITGLFFTSLIAAALSVLLLAAFLASIVLTMLFFRIYKPDQAKMTGIYKPLLATVGLLLVATAPLLFLFSPLVVVMLFMAAMALTMSMAVILFVIAILTLVLPINKINSQFEDMKFDFNQSIARQQQKWQAKNAEEANKEKHEWQELKENDEKKHEEQAVVKPGSEKKEDITIGDKPKSEIAIEEIPTGNIPSEDLLDEKWDDLDNLNENPLYEEQPEDLYNENEEEKRKVELPTPGGDDENPNKPKDDDSDLDGIDLNKSSGGGPSG